MIYLGLVLWAFFQALSVIGVLNYWRHLPADRKVEGPDGAVVILSVRDDWDGGADLIAGLERQEGARFRLLIATSGNCPAAMALAARHPGWVEVIAAGVANDEGQKVHKIRAALRALRAEDRYLVFIDADIAPPARLVGRLLFPLVRGKAEVATGYRLLLPARLALGWIGAVEMQLATLPRPANGTMPWGGAMAMRRDAAERLGLEGALAGRLSDDMTLGLVARRAGLRLRPVRDLLVATPLDGGFGAALDFGMRQYRHVLTNSARMWAVATGVVALQALGWAFAFGSCQWVAISIGYGAAWIRVAARARILRSVLEPEHMRAVWRSLTWDAVAPFLVVWAHLAVQLAASVSRRIGWGGYDYWVRGGRVVRMVRSRG
ncbi:glycosyltransferase [Sphingobium aromaticiconvertens]|uniref:glycosyltransferase n=1 Tax=Sphingobium aromaticiconvertens TaxID=365341 RepID=UPI00301B4776